MFSFLASRLYIEAVAMELHAASRLLWFLQLPSTLSFASKTESIPRSFALKPSVRAHNFSGDPSLTLSQ